MGKSGSDRVGNWLLSNLDDAIAACSLSDCPQNIWTALAVSGVEPTVRWVVPPVSRNFDSPSVWTLEGRYILIDSTVLTLHGPLTGDNSGLRCNG